MKNKQCRRWLGLFLAVGMMIPMSIGSAAAQTPTQDPTPFSGELTPTVEIFEVTDVVPEAQAVDPNERDLFASSQAVPEDGSNEDRDLFAELNENTLYKISVPSTHYFTAPRAGSYTVTTSKSASYADIDTMLNVGGVTNDDYNGTQYSQVRVSLKAGSRYAITTTGYGGRTGGCALKVAFVGSGSTGGGSTGTTAVVGSNRITLPATLSFRPGTTAVYQFSTSGLAVSSFSISSNARTLPYSNLFQGGSNYSITISGSGTGNLNIVQGGTATSATNASLQNDMWGGSAITLNVNGLSSTYSTPLRTAASRINNQTDFTVNISTTTGWPVVLLTSSGSALASATQWVPSSVPSGNIWRPVSRGELRIYTASNIANHDITRVLTHELGHFAGLRDVKNTSYGQSALGIAYANWLMYGTDYNNYTRSTFMTSEVNAINQKANSNNLTRSLAEADFVASDSDTHYDVIVDVYYSTNDLESAVNASDYVVSGIITAIGDTVSDGVEVYRVATVQVAEDLMGNAPTIMSVRLLGGNYQGDEYIYTGAASFEVGDEAVFMLENSVIDGHELFGNLECYITGGEFAYQLTGHELFDASGISILDVIKAELQS